METVSLEALLRASGKRMRDDLEQRLAPHPGETGIGREQIVRRFLQAYLPKRFAVSTGFAFDSQGNISKQLDVIVSDTLICPVFEDSGGIRYFPCESIVAVGQVRSAVKSRAELRDTLANLASAKSLDRSAGGKAIDRISGETLNHLESHLHQIFTFVFVTGHTLAEETVRSELFDYILSNPVHVWPNVIFAFNKYLVTFCCDEGVCANPMDARGIAIQGTSPDYELLMRFYLLLGSAVETTRVSSLPHWEYLQRVRSWSADVYYSVTDDPPPYLHALIR